MCECGKPAWESFDKISMFDGRHGLSKLEP
jgi:hypothetical protein